MKTFFLINFSTYPTSSNAMQLPSKGVLTSI